MNENKKNKVIDVNALIISIAIVSLLLIPILFYLFNGNDKDKEETNVNVPEGCVQCKSDSGVCCPLEVDSTFLSEELSELEIKIGCVKCESSISGKCCPVKKEYLDDIVDGSITCSLTGGICIPIDPVLTEEDIAKGCTICSNGKAMCCPE